MRIKELSLKTGASLRSIRYYEKKGLLPAGRLPNGYRDYDETAIEQVKKIQFYLNMGLTTDNMIAVMDCPVRSAEDRPMCREAYQLYKKKLGVVNSQIEMLEITKRQLQDKIAEFERQQKEDRS